MLGAAVLAGRTSADAAQFGLLHEREVWPQGVGSACMSCCLLAPYLPPTSPTAACPPRQMMPELGFGPEDNDRLVASYSGGWQMRMCLGKILLKVRVCV